jgi:glycosyltransferase involved in cell wall biosynthesis
LGFFGRIEWYKGIDVLLQAFHFARTKHPELRLRFAGEGPHPIPPTEGVTVDGWIRDSRAWFSQIHLLVVPSLGWENLGNSPIEALGFGVPVIVSDSGGLPETVGDFGTVVPQKDANALARAILRVIEDYPAARAVARRGREWVREEFSVQRHLSRLLAIYENALRPTSPPSASGS